MRLGIDFGTTRTVVARADRGNYPIVTLTDHLGDPHEFVPTIAALVGTQLVHGFDAVAAAQEGSPVLRSFKRVLGEPGTTLHTEVDIAGRSFPILDVVTGFLAALRVRLVEELEAAGLAPGERLEAVVSVPAHAHTAQRYLTIEAFRRAGFDVVSLVNEPSAAGFEYTHRQPRTLSSRRTEVLVYDLGGGTFDASLVQAEGVQHDVLASVGVNRLGGDDVDVILAETALRLAAPAESITRAQWRTLVEDARDAKERLTPQSRRIVLDVADEAVIVPVEAFYAAATPFVEASIAAMEPLVGQLDAESSHASLASVAGIYLVGGGSGLPLVPRLLRERFGRRVYRSPYPAAATAIGLAIAADPDSGFTLRDRLSRGFGVFRERDGGADLGFDEIFPRETRLPREGTATVTRRYAAAHNVGWFRYVEYPELDDDGNPAGALVPYAELLVPFDDELQAAHDPADLAGLADVAVQRTDAAHEIEETYTVDADGVVEVVIADLTSGYRRSVRL